MILTRPGGYGLSRECCDVDIDLARSALAAARAADSPERRRQKLREALDFFRGDPFDDVPSDYLRHRYVGALRSEWLLVLESWAQEQVRTDPAQAVGPLRAATASDPHQESIWALLIEALAASGQRADALASYQRARLLLLEDLGIEPGPELQRAQQSVLSSTVAVPPIALTGPLNIGAVNACAVVVERFAALCRGGPTPRAALVVCGPPGAGKTFTLARAAAAVADRFPRPPTSASVLGPDGAAAAPAVIAGELLRRWNESADDPVAVVTGAWSRHPGLIVLDDAARSADYGWLLPVPPGCGLLVGSLAPSTRVEQVQLVGYSASEVRELLHAASARTGIQVSRRALSAVNDFLDGLPAAVHTLLDRLDTEPELDLDRVAARLADPDRLLGELRSSSFDVGPQLGKTYRRLAGPGRRAFRLLGWLDTRSFSTAVAAAALQLPTDIARNTIGELREYGLVQVESQGTRRRFRMSPVIRALARQISAYTDDQLTREAVVRRALTAWYSSDARPAPTPKAQARNGAGDSAVIFP